MKNKILLALLTIPFLVLGQTKQDFIKQAQENPSSIETLRVIQRVGGYDPDYKEMRVLFKGLDKAVRKSAEGKAFDYYLKRLESVAVGKKAPGITQLTPEGDPLSLSDLKGKYVLIDFWASWCPPCRKESPELVATYAQFKDKKFEILGVSFDKNMEDWVAAIKKDNRNWKHISDLQHWSNGAGIVYGVRAIPQNVLVNPAGKIIARNLHGDQLKQKLSEILD
ncbi:TlpA disulfide reductase family protein [Sphingobacterium sp. UT-1RO-CII-1]|uniref:TlpA family protein disulfide reductase n=1 Tax=Sphingobacterium sp. UT-1RO-CII-1 TaxID=2995225 RepID=UPI00227A661C|nr:TlpA disulfide reductase family protein [Sphingobacterium sp. UT-1RO-CII-1]MCY4780896.1 TlpA disulfide reductase family protein [Sphingobacterium sp. UT-1RO-CII-1]